MLSLAADGALECPALIDGNKSGLLWESLDCYGKSLAINLGERWGEGGNTSTLAGRRGFYIFSFFVVIRETVSVMSSPDV